MRDDRKVLRAVAAAHLMLGRRICAADVAELLGEDASDYGDALNALADDGLLAYEGPREGFDGFSIGEDPEGQRVTDERGFWRPTTKGMMEAMG
ncbi:MAG: hypothetical protein ABW167_16560 [Baekduia sp.]